jgi:ribosomal-protein-serine acetyltransferase
MLPDFELKITETLSLRLRKPEDAQAIFELVDRNREEFRQWLPWVDTTKSSEDTLKFIQMCIAGFTKKESLDLGIISEGKWVGSVGLHTISAIHQYGEIGYWLDKDAQGKGIITQCVKALTTYGFESLNLHRIEILCASVNVKSKAVPERLGFVLEGTVRENRIVNGAFCDTLIYGMLKNDWK